jgi:hypothetical protein
VTDYDRYVSDAKHQVTQLLCSVVSDDERKHRFGVEQLPGAIDGLNKAWDELTDCLVRQVAERDREIRSLLNQLAEAKKTK